MKLDLAYKFLIVSYLSVCVILCSEGSLKSKVYEKRSADEEMRNTFTKFIDTNLSGPVIDLISDYYSKSWETKRLDPSETKGLEFKIRGYDLFIDISNILDPITSNGRKLFYDKGSKNLIIKEEAKFLDSSMKKIRKKSLPFICREGEWISVYLGNRYLVIRGRFQHSDGEFYANLDIYDLNDQKFWDAEFKANSNGKTILSGIESYGTHIEPNILYPTYGIGMWRNKKEEYVIIPLAANDSRFEKLIDKELQENREDSENDLVIGAYKGIVVLDLTSIKEMDFISFTNDGQIMKISGEDESEELIETCYKIKRGEGRTISE